MPYIADHIYNHPEYKSAGINLQGILIFDGMRCLNLNLNEDKTFILPFPAGETSWDVVTEQIPAFSFVEKWNNVMSLKRVAIVDR